VAPAQFALLLRAVVAQQLDLLLRHVAALRLVYSSLRMASVFAPWRRQVHMYLQRDFR
jgi:hypothetical protein